MISARAVAFIVALGIACALVVSTAAHADLWTRAWSAQSFRSAIAKDLRWYRWKLHLKALRGY